MPATKGKGSSKAAKKPVNAVATAAKSKAAAQKPADEPLKVSVVPPGTGLTEQQVREQQEAASPENAANRAASYAMPVEGVNQNAAEE